MGALAVAGCLAAGCEVAGSFLVFVADLFDRLALHTN